MHLRAGSLPVTESGNSGTSTGPHVHLQVMDRPDLETARGMPMAFRTYRGWVRGAPAGQLTTVGVPGEGAVVELVDDL